MDPIVQAILAEEHRQEINRQIRRIRLEEQALRAGSSRTDWFSRRMHGLGRWLIARGQGLVERYEAPQNLYHPTDRRFAH